MDLLIFALGVGVGAGLYHLWQKSMLETKYIPGELELRLQALEEQLAYVSSKLEELPDEPRPVRARSRKQGTATASKKQDLILELKSQGLDEQAIARELGVPQGQVELVARLFRKEMS